MEKDNSAGAKKDAESREKREQKTRNKNDIQRSWHAENMLEKQIRQIS